MTPARLYPVTLTGKLIGLRELTVHDVRAVQAIVGDPAVCETLIYPPKNLDATAEYVNRAIRDARQNPRTSYFLGVVEAEGGELVGTARIGLGEFSSGNIGYAIRYDRWNRGYATEATRLLARFGFEALALHRVWASHGPDNPSSGRVLLKAGMTYEGRLRQNVVDKGAWRDSLVYSVLVDEVNSLRGGS